MGSNNSKSKDKQDKKEKKRKSTTKASASSDNNGTASTARSTIDHHHYQESSSSFHTITTTTTLIDSAGLITRTRSQSVSHNQSASPAIAAIQAPIPNTISYAYTNPRTAQNARGPLSGIWKPPSSPIPVQNMIQKFSSPSPSPKTSTSFFGNVSSSPKLATDAIGYSIKLPKFSDYNLEPSNKAMKVVVKKTPTLIRPNPHVNGVPTYNTTGAKRGMALIINNIEFSNSSFVRHGAKVDGENLKNLFTKLNIAPLMRINLTRKSMETTFNTFARNYELNKVDICFIVVMSHGTGTVDTVTSIAGTDEGEIKVSDILQCFSNTGCPYLKGKPKIFIFQCCRGDNEIVEHDALPVKKDKLEDMLLAYATLPGFVALRNVSTGSYYIQAICKVFMEHACDKHITDMLVIVQELLKKYSSAKQNSSYESLSFKNCYLNPV